MKRKLLAGLLATVCATCLAFGLSACKKHTHTYATEWTIDGTYHWHAATCDHTDEISDKAEHGLAGGVCPVCKYERPVSEGLEYTLSDDGTYYIVTGIGTCTDTDIVIPSEHETLPVKAIESYAFWDSSLTSIAISDSVTSIGDMFDCGFTSITVDENNQYYKSIDGNLYNKDGTALIQYAAGKTATQFTVPDGVTSIEGFAFYYCSSLESIAISDGVTAIGEYAFYNCSSLTSITIPDSVTSIGMEAFGDCRSLASVTIGSGVTSIGVGAFEFTPALAGITVDENNRYYKSIDGNLYNKDGTTLTRYVPGKTAAQFIIPDSVTSIGEYAFSFCSLTSVTIPDGVTSIGKYAFYTCSSLTSITIPDSVTSIGMDAFGYCDSLKYNEYDNAYYLGNENNPYVILMEVKDTSVTSCTIHENTKFIHNHAFSRCTSLESVAIPDGVKGIGGYAFAYCSSLTSATIPDSVTYIGDAFYDCISLKSIIFKGTKEEWNAIEKGGNWEWNTRLCTVYCTDGDIAPAADRM